MLGAYGLYATASLFSGHPLGAIAAAALLAIVLGGARVLRADAAHDRRDGAGRRAHHHRAGHPPARRHRAGVGRAGAASAARARLAQRRAARRRQRQDLRRWASRWCWPPPPSISACGVFLRRTRWGIRMRAAGQNPLLAAQRGIGLHGIYALAWSLATFTGGLVGHADRVRLGARPGHGGHRPQGVSRRAGRRARQPARHAPRRAHRRRPPRCCSSTT